MPRLSVDLTENQHKQLKSKAAWLGLTQSDIVRRFLDAWFDQQIDVPEEESSHEQPEPHILAE